MTSEYRDIYTVSRLNNEARALLEGSFPLLWIEGEISNFACPASGHWYFSLKDQKAQARCAMFRNRNAHLGFVPKNGMQVLIRARISLYEARGEFQLIAEHMEEAGDGALRRAFEELKNKLQQEGLFAVEHKKPLPSHIQTIGVITSPSGAAIRDILTTLKRRYPSARVIIYPVAVQGSESAPQISAMIRTVNMRQECDVILLTRGGGSLEDLWSFNEEMVARAIFDCTIPIVCGVGHEVDITIADLVADFRAATPTAAAEMVSPDQHELGTRLLNNAARLENAMTRVLRNYQQQLNWLTQSITHPGRRIQELAQRLDDMQLRLSQIQTHHMRHLMMHLNVVKEKLVKLHPTQTINLDKQRLGGVQFYQFIQLTKTLNAVSPLATLERGYAIVSDDRTGDILCDASEVKKGTHVKARLHRGQLHCTVNDIDYD